MSHAIFGTRQYKNLFVAYLKFKLPGHLIFLIAKFDNPSPLGTETIYDPALMGEVLASGALQFLPPGLGSPSIYST